MNSVALLPEAASGLTMDSLEIAELLRSNAEEPPRHDNVKVTIERLAAKGAIALPAMQEVSNPRSGPKMITVYLVNKRDSYVVVAQLSPEFTARLVDRWQQLETQAASVALPDFSNPAAAARAWAEQYEQRQISDAQRDEAIRTKAQIGNKREATAMATASAAAREAAKLRDTLGFSARHATIIAVENQTDRKFGQQGYQPLRKYCKTNGLRPEKVHDPRWGVATAWPAVAWKAVYGIDLCELFPDAALEAA